MDHLIRFTQTHTSFRLAEIEACSNQIRQAYARKGVNVTVQVREYREESPFCVVRFHVRRGLGRGKERGREVERGKREGMSVVNGEGVGVGRTSNGESNDEENPEEGCEYGYDEDRDLRNQVARDFTSLSIQAKGIYELWGLATLTSPSTSNAQPSSSSNTITAMAAGIGTTTDSLSSLPPLYPLLHKSTLAKSSHLLPLYKHTPSFKFSIDSFQGRHTEAGKREIINSFAYFGLQGEVSMKGAEVEFVIMEEWVSGTVSEGQGTRETTVVDEGQEDRNGKNPPTALVGADGDGDAEKRTRRQRVSHDLDTSLPSQQHISNSNSSSQSKTISAPSLSRSSAPSPKLTHLFLTLHLSSSRRNLISKHTLKSRPYISTTSMDAELALLTANLALAAPGKLFLDPFCGTGGFMVAVAELGAFVMGGDIDGRSFRGGTVGGQTGRGGNGKKEGGSGRNGKGGKRGVWRNFEHYSLHNHFGDCFVGDLVNTPLRKQGKRWLDGIICDPPYGVREGLKVLGSTKTDHPTPARGASTDDGEAACSLLSSSMTKLPHRINGVLAHTLPDYIAPKKPYSFERMLDDILDFAARTLVDGGRLAFWMPTANDTESEVEGEGEGDRMAENGLEGRGDGVEEGVMPIPRHPLLELKHECVQRFNRWSRRLLVYERLCGEMVVEEGGRGLTVSGRATGAGIGTRADDLNPFRRRYFQAFAEKPNG